MIRFVYGTGDLDYDLSFIRKTIRADLPEMISISGSFHEFFKAQNFLVMQSFVLKDYDTTFKLLSENHRNIDITLISDLLDSPELFVFYFPSTPFLLHLENKYSLQIPIPNLEEKKFRFIKSLGFEHPLIFNQNLNAYPISFLEYAAKLLLLNPKMNPTSLDEVVDLAGNFIIIKLSSHCEKLFRSFLVIKDTGEVTTQPFSIELIQKKTGFEQAELKEWIEIAKKNLFLKEDSFGKIQLYNHYLHEYWSVLKDWSLKEKEGVNQLLFFRNLAILYQKQKGDLLSETQILSAQNWLNSFYFSLPWAEQYIRETDLVLNYIRFSEKHNISLQQAKENRRKKTLKRTRNIAVLISFAFIFSSVAAVFALLERNNALLARNQIIKEKQIALDAKILAESETKNALIAREAEANAKSLAISASETAISEKLKAIQAKEEADREKLAAIEAREEEEKAKLLAEEQTKRAILAIQAETEAKKLATENFLNAERLRQQQIARNQALQSIQLYNEGKYSEGLEIAKIAYEKNLENGGTVFESDFYKSLVIGASYSQLSSIGAPYPIKNIELSPNSNYLITLSTHGKLTLLKDPYTFQDQKLPFEFQIDKVQSFCFLNDTLVVLGYHLGEIGLLSLNTHKIIQKVKISDQPIKSIGFDKKIWGATESKIYSCSSQLDSISVFPIPDFREKEFLDFIPDLEEYLVQKNGLVSLHAIQPSSLKSNAFSIPFNEPISSAYKIFDSSFVLFGDKLGYLHLGDFKKRKIINSLKVHDSGISSIIFLKIKNQDIIVTSGFDHKITIIPFEKTTFAFLNPITLIGHSGWVTDLHYDYSKEILISGGNDQIIRYWIINPDKIK